MAQTIEARRAYHRRYRQEHLVAVREYHRKYGKEHPEARRKAGRKYRTEHPEAVQAYNCQYAASHRDAINAYYRRVRMENPEPVRKRNREWDAAARPRRAHSDTDLKRVYGITRKDFDALRDSQDGRCAICGEKFSATPHVDHCHVTGTVRGLLCGQCNRGLGFFHDDPDRLEQAIVYLMAEK